MDGKHMNSSLERCTTEICMVKMEDVLLLLCGKPRSGCGPSNYKDHVPCVLLLRVHVPMECGLEGGLCHFLATTVAHTTRKTTKRLRSEK